MSKPIARFGVVWRLDGHTARAQAGFDWPPSKGASFGPCSGPETLIA
jgi:hypothetical protein